MIVVQCVQCLRSPDGGKSSRELEAAQGTGPGAGSLPLRLILPKQGAAFTPGKYIDDGATDAADLTKMSPVVPFVGK